MHFDSLSGRVVVITGASSGFGKGVALRLARESTSLVLVARRAHLLIDLAEECQRAGARALAVMADVANPEDVIRIHDEALRAFGRIDVWINNAGVGALGRFEAVPLVDHLKVMQTNLGGTISGSWVALRRFLFQGYGTLINVASELGAHTVPYYASYTASKHGVVGLDESLQQEIDAAHAGDIHVCTVLPAAHDTPFFEHVANYTGHEVVPPRPLHDPADVVEAIVRLAHHPEKAKTVGGDGAAKFLLRKVAPGLEEEAMSFVLHREQMERAPHADLSPGAVRAPMAHGTGVSGHRVRH